MVLSPSSFKDSKINRIGFGCWQLAGDYDLNGKPNGYGTIDTAESIRAILLAIDNGIIFFDTAVSYGLGKSEKVLGSAIKAQSASTKSGLFICTKYGIVPGNESEDDFSGTNLIRSVEGSLKRLQVDCLGAILLHNPPDDFDFSNFDTTPFEQLIRAGKILSYGVSCRTQKGVANVLNHGFGSVIEAVYNPLDRRYEAHFSNPLYENKYVFICRVPLASGFISPRTLIEVPAFEKNDIRNNFSDEQVSWVTDSVRKLTFLNDLEGGIVVSALRFQLSNRHNTIVIPGLKNTRQVKDAILAQRLGPLSQDILDKISEAVPDVFYKWRG